MWNKIIKPKALKKGDTIGVVATSDPIVEEDIEDINKSVELIKKLGLKVKFAKHVYENTLGYSETAKNKAEDINEMFKDKEVDAIFCAEGGYNSNAVFEYLDFDIIKKNPKILCGYSDPTSLINIISEKTGLVTFYGPNFKSLSSEETDYGYREMISRFIEKSLKIGKIYGDESNQSVKDYKVINEGKAEGKLIRRKFIFVFKSNYRKIQSKCRE